MLAAVRESLFCLNNAIAAVCAAAAAFTSAAVFVGVVVVGVVVSPVSVGVVVSPVPVGGVVVDVVPPGGVVPEVNSANWAALNLVVLPVLGLFINTAPPSLVKKYSCPPIVTVCPVRGPVGVVVVGVVPVGGVVVGEVPVGGVVVDVVPVGGVVVGEVVIGVVAGLSSPTSLETVSLALASDIFVV